VGRSIEKGIDKKPVNNERNLYKHLKLLFWLKFFCYMFCMDSDYTFEFCIVQWEVIQFYATYYKNCYKICVVEIIDFYAYKLHVLITFNTFILDIYCVNVTYLHCVIHFHLIIMKVHFHLFKFVDVIRNAEFLKTKNVND